MSAIPKIGTKPDSGSEDGPELVKVISALADIVTSGIDVHRCQAAKALGQIGHPQAVEPLIAALLDEDEDVRTDAAEALAKIGDPAASDQLFENLLGDPCLEVKIAAVDALVKAKDGRIAEWLGRVVKGRDEETAWDDQGYYTSGWDDWVDIQIKAISALADLEEDRAVPEIVEAVKDDEVPDIAETAFKALTRIGPNGVEAVGKFLNDPVSRTRRRAASALAGASSEKARELYPYAFSDPSSEVRLAALRARAKIDPNDVWLAVMLEDKDEDVRAEAVDLLGRVYPTELAPLLEDPSPKVRAKTLVMLAKTKELSGEPEMVLKMADLINDPGPDVAAAACVAFASFDPDNASPLLEQVLTNTDFPPEIRVGALKGLRSIRSNPAISALISVIDDPVRQIRLEVMAALSRVASQSNRWPNMAGDALLLALQGSYAPELETPETAEIVDLSEAREEATAEVSEPQEDEEITTAVVDQEAPVTSTLESILQEQPEIRSFAGLPNQGIELSPDDLERLAMARQTVGKRKMPRIEEVVVHEDVQRFAAKVLGDLDHADVQNALADALAAEDAEVAAAAADSMARISGRTARITEDAQRAIIKRISAVSGAARVPLIRALACCKDAESTERLVDLIGDDDSSIRAEAIRSLSHLQPSQHQFDSYLEDSDPSVRLSAAKAVARTGGQDAAQVLSEFALSYEGYHGRQVARILRNIDKDQANASFLEILASPERRRFWSVAIEALEELNQQRGVA